MRMSVYKLGNGVVLIDDAYNASPLSVRSALLSLSDVEGKRRVAVLGGMLELGALARDAHIEVGKLSVFSGVDQLVAVGEQARWIVEGALAAGLDERRVLALFRRAGDRKSRGELGLTGRCDPRERLRGFRLEQVSAAVHDHFGPRHESEAEKNR